MRTGGYTVQQALTQEAANIVRQALTLAKRRGHAQVTPLHVANTMLSPPTSLLRTACLQSHSHPLQCKALELCFNVALNRLPASSSNPMFGSHSISHPSISNALIAAFKRAQAHQRRGSVENQQQPLLAVKIEVEQLIISILDDPSVSRVMREAGFSSTQVKINVEKAVSLELCSQIVPPQHKKPKECNPLALSQSPPNSQVLGQLGLWLDEKRKKDVIFVIENMLKSKRRNIVVVGECVSTMEGVVGGLVENFDKGDVHEELREIKFISLPLFSLGQLSREEIEEKFFELKCLMKRCSEKGLALYWGDLKWVSEYRSSSCDMEYYSQVDQIVMEIGKLGCGIGESGRFWFIGIASPGTYMKCKSGNPSLESLWGLHPITIPSENLSLGFTHESDTQSGSVETRDLAGLRSSSICTIQATSSTLPSWLQKYKDEIKSLKDGDQGCDSRRELRERTISFTSLSPSCSTSSFSYDPSFTMNNSSNHKDPIQTLSPGQSSTLNLNSSNDVMEIEYVPRFKELNYENFKILCASLEQQVPWQKDILPEIASTILQCRSRMAKIKEETRPNEAKEETWILFEGIDVEAKEKIARELARVIFGSPSNLVGITLSGFSCSRIDSTQNLGSKSSRDEQSGSYLDQFWEAISHNPHSVFFLEDIEQLDYCLLLSMKEAIKKGKVSNSYGNEVSLCDAIVILCCKNVDSISRTCFPLKKQKTSDFDDERNVSLDLNISLEDTSNVEEESIDDVGLLECLDRRIFFKAQLL